MKKIIYFIAALLTSLLVFYYLQNKKTGKGTDPTTMYQLVKNWPQLPENFRLGNPTGIGIDSSQNIFVFHRAGRKWPLFGSMPQTLIGGKTILLIDRETGKIMNSWGENIFIMPHGLTVDDRNNVWITDVGLHQVFKFDHDGQLLMKIGEAKVPGNDSKHFNRPTDVAVSKDGSVYVSDGYRNSRVVKFSADGKYLFEWGKKGSKEGEFNISHGLGLDDYGNVYVADRENNRVQVFDSSGRFLKQFAGKNVGNICSVSFDKKRKQLIAADDLSFLKIKHRGSDIFVFDSTGNVLSRFGRSGLYDGPRCWYHDLSTDRQGNIYVGDIAGNRVQKFIRISAGSK